MKNLTLIFMVLLITVQLSSCTNSDDTAPLGGKMIVNGVEYPLLSGSILSENRDNATDDEKRSYYIGLSNGELGMENTLYTFSDSITQMVAFNLYCKKGYEGTVEATTYKLLTPPNDRNDAFIRHCGIYTNVVVQDGLIVSDDDLSSLDMTKGEVKVSIADGIYTIVFSFSNATNTVSGSYRGTLSELSYEN